MPSAFSVVALLAAYNEADIIHHVVADLIRQGLQVYFLDDGSTDDTVKVVEPFVGRGVLCIERRSGGTRADGPDRAHAFEWERILLRKSELAAELDASWFIHHDADEFRESPWAHLSLREAIRQVDALGFNAIDFAGLDFWPVDDRFRPGGDVREAFTSYSELAPYDRLQIRCWKKTEHPVDLASSGGHEAKFPDRKVFPVRFILRHYPIRSQAHGERKVFQERRNRFLDRERARGWHVQYDATRTGASFLRDPSTLTRYDADAVRIGLTLRHRGVEALEEAVAVSPDEIGRLRADAQWSQAQLARTRAELDAAIAEVERLTFQRSELQAHADAQSAYIGTLTAALDQRAADIEGWRKSVECMTRRLEELERSFSWRWTAPARTALRALRGR